MAAARSARGAVAGRVGRPGHATAGPRRRPRARRPGRRAHRRALSAGRVRPAARRARRGAGPAAQRRRRSRDDDARARLAARRRPDPRLRRDLPRPHPPMVDNGATRGPTGRAQAWCPTSPASRPNRSTRRSRRWNPPRSPLDRLENVRVSEEGLEAPAPDCDPRGRPSALVGWRAGAGTARSSRSARRGRADPRQRLARSGRLGKEGAGGGGRRMARRDRERQAALCAWL